MKVGLAQIAPTLGQLSRNIDLHLELMEKAQEENIDLLLFPELSLTGYTLKDLTEDIAIRPNDSKEFERLISASRGFSTVFGFIEEKDRGLFYNSAAFVCDQKINHIHRKVFLPTYGLFEEGKFYARGKNVHTFDAPFGKTGMLVCYDFLHLGACYLLFAGGAEFIIVISAAPGRGMDEDEGWGSSPMWELMGEALSRFTTSFVFYCNRAGFEEGVSFAGGSFVYNPYGKQIGRAAYAERDFLICEIDPSDIAQARKKRFYRRDDRPEIISAALQRIVRAYED
jgi:predicted amidohydrolase